MKRFSVSVLLALLLTTLAVIPALAEGGHIYGVVFMDGNGNGKWDIEAGVSNVLVHFVNGETEVVQLRTAWTDNLNNHLSGPDSENPGFDPDIACSHLSESHFVGDDWATRPDFKGCSGTIGLTPAPQGGGWKVYIDLPAHTALSHEGACGDSLANACNVVSKGIGELGWFEIGIKSTASDASTTVQPGTRVYKANKPVSVKLHPVPVTGIAH